MLLRSYDHSDGLLIFFTAGCRKMGAMTAARPISFNLWHNVRLYGDNFQETIFINSIIKLCLFSLFDFSSYSFTKAELIVARDYSFGRNGRNTALELLAESEINRGEIESNIYQYKHICISVYIHIWESVYMYI